MRSLKAIWPDTSHLEGARNASSYGFMAAIVVAVSMAVIALYSEFVSPLEVFDIWGLLDAFLFAAIAIGIWRSSRVFAIIGIALYLTEQWYLWSTDGLGNIVIAIVLTLMFINGVRGTVAIHSINNKTA